MHIKSKAKSKKSLTGIFALFGISFALGLSPVIFNIIVDPYQVISIKERPTAINDLAEKSHYPLWKLAKYEVGQHDTVILGDSRARALRDKYWHEAGVPKALNLAYGGGTIPEIYSTFKRIENDPAIKRLIVGIQLRSFDEKHKGGMNRVPEAVKLLSSDMNYLKNWHVAKTSAKVFRAENAEVIQHVLRLSNHFSINANANELGRNGETPLEKLLEPKICFGCDLPVGLSAVPYVRTGLGTHRGLRDDYLRYYTGLEGINRSHLPSFLQADHTLSKAGSEQALPEKFARQVRKNGSADWRGFEESQQYWRYLEDIATWARGRNVKLIFVVPPTLVAMQQTISQSGLDINNFEMRLRLATMGQVVDLDFPNSLTLELNNFSDAYHFNSLVARSMVSGIVSGLKQPARVKRRKTAFDLRCTTPTSKKKTTAINDDIRLVQGVNCRVWEKKS